MPVRLILREVTHNGVRGRAREQSDEVLSSRWVARVGLAGGRGSRFAYANPNTAIRRDQLSACLTLGVGALRVPARDSVCTFRRGVLVVCIRNPRANDVVF